MSFMLKVSKQKDELVIGKERKTPSPVFFSSDKHSILIGEIFGNITEEDVLSSGWEKAPEILDHYGMTACLVSCQEEECFFMSDITATETIYYYMDAAKDMYLSDDFWDLVREIKPGIEDIDIDNFKMRLFLGGGMLLNEESIVKGIKYLNPGMMAVYHRKNRTLSIRRVQRVIFNGKKKTYDDVVDGLDAALDRNLKEIKAKFSDDTVYGIGLSGGLDSRIVLHYAVKNGMKCVCFNCCMEKPNKVFRARSVRMAEKIAKIYHVPFYVVEWDIEELEQILEDKRKFYPNGNLFEQGTDIFKINYKRMPKFDVLLSGGGGAGQQFFSSHYPDISFDNDELAEFILKDYVLCCQNSTSNKIKKVFQYLVGKESKKRTVKYRFTWQKKLYEMQAPIVMDRIKRFVQEMRNAGATDSTEILFDFRSIMLGKGSRYGAFESRFGLDRSFFAYHPYVMSEGNEWSPELLKNRMVLKELICRKIPEISMVGEETYSPAPGKKGNALQMKTAKLAAVVDKAVAGNGSHIAKKYWKSKKIKEAFWKDWNNECTWFKEYLRLGGILLSEKDIFKTDHYIMLNLWDLKRLVDAIETGNYE